MKTYIFWITVSTILVSGCSSTLPRDVADRVDGKLAYAYVHHIKSADDANGTTVHLNYFQDGGDFVNGPGVVAPGKVVKSGSIVKVRMSRDMLSSAVPAEVVAVDPRPSCGWVGGHGGFSAGGVVCDGWDYKVDLPFKGVSLFGKAY